MTWIEHAGAVPPINPLLPGDGHYDVGLDRARRIVNVYLYDWHKWGAVPTACRICKLPMIPSSPTALKFGNTARPRTRFDHFERGRMPMGRESQDTADSLNHAENAWLVKSGTIDDPLGIAERRRDDDVRVVRIKRSTFDEFEECNWDARSATSIK